MKINISNYKNIEKLELEVEDNKVNHIFGISGSGKSSIAKALSSQVTDSDIKAGKKIPIVLLGLMEKKWIFQILVFLI